MYNINQTTTPQLQRQEALAHWRILNAALDRALDLVESPQFYQLNVSQQSSALAEVSRIGHEMELIKC